MRGRKREGERESRRERENDRKGWLRFVGSIKLQVSFAEYGLFYRSLLQKRPIILSILLTEATPYDTGWRRCIACLKLQVSFRKRTTNQRALVRKMTCKDKASYASSPPCRVCERKKKKEEVRQRKRKKDDACTRARVRDGNTIRRLLKIIGLF